MKESKQTQFLFLVDWMLRLAYVNILWLLFVIAGLGLFGFMPSTVAMYTVMKKWIHEKGTFPLFSIFLKTYKMVFFKANFLFIIITLFGVILYSDILFLFNKEGILQWIGYCFIGISIVYMLVLANVVPVFVDFSYNLTKSFKYALLIGLAHPIRTILVIFLMMVNVLFIFYFPGMILFYSGSVMSLLITLFFYHWPSKKKKLEGTKWRLQYDKQG
jgi:uncharacterized membrane protein YesL